MVSFQLNAKSNNRYYQSPQLLQARNCLNFEDFHRNFSIFFVFSYSFFTMVYFWTLSFSFMHDFPKLLMLSKKRTKPEILRKAGIFQKIIHIFVCFLKFFRVKCFSLFDYSPINAALWGSTLNFSEIQLSVLIKPPDLKKYKSGVLAKWPNTLFFLILSSPAPGLLYQEHSLSFGGRSLQSILLLPKPSPHLWGFSVTIFIRPRCGQTYFPQFFCYPGHLFVSIFSLPCNQGPKIFNCQFRFEK